MRGSSATLTPRAAEAHMKRVTLGTRTRQSTEDRSLFDRGDARLCSFSSLVNLACGPALSGALCKNGCVERFRRCRASLQTPRRSTRGLRAAICII